MVLKITNLHILRYLPTCWLYLLECYNIDNQRCTHTIGELNKLNITMSKVRIIGLNGRTCMNIEFIE